MDGDDNNRAQRLRDRAYALTDLTTWWREPPSVFNSMIRDVAMRKGKHGLRGQARRRATLTGARLNGEIIRLAVPHDAPKLKRRVPAYALPPNFGLEPSGATWNPSDIEPPQLAGQSWGAVCDDPDIAKQIKRENETDKCDASARSLLDGAVTERERIAGLNDRHRALLEAIVGTSTYDPPPTMSHYAEDIESQTAAMDMVFAEEVGFGLWKRRDRHNNFHPGKAGPCRTLTGEALIAAIAALRPAKKHGKRYPRGDEACLFDKCRRAGRKQPMDYMVPVQWDKIAPTDCDLIVT